MEKKRVTIYDIAKKLNLTASSVSRALNNVKHVNENTRQLVLKTAREMNYKHNTIASNLRKGRSNTIGVIVPRINQNFFANVIAGIEQVANRNGYSIIICQSDESQEHEIQCVNTLINQHVDCIVISVTADNSGYAHLQSIIDHHIALVQFDRVVDELDTLKVINDNETVSFNAVEHLIKTGYRRIALLEGPQNLGIFRERKKGYLKALAKYKLPVVDELIVANAWTQELGAEATRSLMRLSTPPDAIFASTSDFAALGVMDAAREMGISLPGQLGICGYSNEAFTEFITPSLTTIDQFSNYMGKTISELFFQEIDNDEQKMPSKTVSIRPKLIIRSSTLKN